MTNETTYHDNNHGGDDVPVIAVNGSSPSSRRNSNDTLFYCRCESVKPMSTLLSCLRQFAARAGAGAGVGNSDPHHAASTSLSMVRGGAGVGDHMDESGMAEGGNDRNGADARDRSFSNSRRSSARQQATVYASAGGLTVIVHGMARQSQASVDIHSGLFTEFTVSEERIPIPNIGDHDDDHESDENNGDDDNVPKQQQQYETIQGGEFSINLTTLLESLHVLGTNPKDLERTKLYMSYDRAEAILRIELEDRFGVLATSAVMGSVPDFEYDEDDEDADEDENGGGGGARSSSLAVAFRRSPVLARAIVKSNYFKAAVAELAEVAGASCCTIGIAPNRMELGTVGHAGECLVHLPKSSEVSHY
jgi:hypothetical protein